MQELRWAYQWRLRRLRESPVLCSKSTMVGAAGVEVQLVAMANLCLLPPRHWSTTSHWMTRAPSRTCIGSASVWVPVTSASSGMWHTSAPASDTPARWSIRTRYQSHSAIFSRPSSLWHGCCLSVCHECIVAKRCEIGPRLLLITNSKSHIGF